MLPLAVASPPVHASPASAAVAPPQGDWASLEATAKKQGEVPVIVTLNTSTTIKAPDRLDKPGLESQIAAIARANARLLALLGPVNALKTMMEFPLVAFHATSADLARLQRSPLVVDVTEDLERALDVSERTATESKSIEGVAGPQATSNSGQYTQLTNWWDYYRIGVDKAAAAGYRGTGQTVAIIDSGVDRTHNWITNVVNEACFASATVGSSAGYCPNGAWKQLGFNAARPCLQAGCAHGTHVAHTAAGTNGVAPAAKIMAIQVFHPGATGITYWDSDLIWAMKHVYDVRSYYKIAAVNLSLGYSLKFVGYCDNYYSTTSDIGKLTGWINLLKSVGIASVIASGNSGFRGGVSHPACLSNAVTVGNTTLVGTATDAVFTSSNSGPQIDLLAPGTDICSAVPGNRYECAWIGTSMAAPHVAGAYAVLRQKRPTATVDQILLALQRSGVAVADGQGITRTRINVYTGLQYLN
ncbi:S8 family peptidase [Micromonospora sp. DT81.3]|uniref:S8 family peptidase n=1 Tax=Actinomycetes TaxID=1760 RepID=UPI003CE941FA